MELSEGADVTPRTVRYYIAQGLLPAPGAGPKARYDDRHVKRLRLVRELQRQHLPLSEIRGRLQMLDDHDIDRLLDIAQASPASSAIDYIHSVIDARPAYRALMAALPPPTGVLPPQSPSPAPPDSSVGRSQWERLALTQDIELHIRRPLSRHQNRQVERLVAFARQLLQEDPR